MENCLPDASFGKIAIFGMGEAARLAYIFALEAGLYVECFVDDFESGVFLDKCIVDWQFYLQKYEKFCDFLLCGPYQKGEICQRKSEKPIVLLKMEWFV